MVLGWVSVFLDGVLFYGYVRWFMGGIINIVVYMYYLFKNKIVSFISF